MNDNAGLSDVKVAELKEAFSLFDKDNEGAITPQKLGVVMKNLAPSLNPTDEELKELIDEVDTSGDSKLVFKDFLDFMTERMKTTDVDEEINEAFKVFDINKTGAITPQELQQVMAQLGEVLTDMEVAAMIKQSDKTGDGTIKYQEFAKLMKMSDD